MDRLRRHISYANVVSSLALFLVLGGTAWAVATNSIGTRQIKNNSVRSTDLRNGSLRSKDVLRGSLGGHAIKESALGKVPRAKSADRVGGKSGTQLTLHCPSGTSVNQDACIETRPRDAQPYGGAAAVCETAGRRLPTHQELLAYAGDSTSTLAPGGELTADVYPASPPSDPLNVLVVTSKVGQVTVVPDTFAGRRPYRCVVAKGN
jgi:hypothetical protein